MATDRQIDVMARHYIIAAIWADCEEGTSPRATKAAIAAAKKECATFCQRAGDLIERAAARHADGYGTHPDCGSVEPAYAAMGHDLWLTRQHHGVGFWDRTELDADGLGDQLTEVCHRMGEPNYEFYRGWLYLY